MSGTDAFKAPMRVYHTTTPTAARAIEAQGFRDGEGQYLTLSIHRGVWLANCIVDEGNSFPKAELLSVTFEVLVNEAALAEYEWIEEPPEGVDPAAVTYREWLVPAAIVNALPRRRLTDEEKADVEAEIFEQRLRDRVRRRGS